MEGHKPHSLEHLPFEQEGFFIHYTCNAPDKEILEGYGIESIGKRYGCISDREVLKIPRKLLQRFHFQFTKDKNCLNLNLENLLIKIENEYKRLDNELKK
jgi:hypothetical protein